jgi:plasmid stabilization system protein ParE
MKIRFSETSRTQLKEVKSFIEKDNPQRAVNHVRKVVDQIKTMLQFPYIGKVNSVYNRKDIREIVVEGYKVIYQIDLDHITILVIYKNIDFDESSIPLS